MVRTNSKIQPGLHSENGAMGAKRDSFEFRGGGVSITMCLWHMVSWGGLGIFTKEMFEILNHFKAIFKPFESVSILTTAA